MLFQHLFLWAEEKPQLQNNNNPSVTQDSDHIFHSLDGLSIDTGVTINSM